MKPIDQTLFGDGVGNCFTACVASILELPLEGLPNFCVEYPDPWFPRFESWLAARGVFVVSFNFMEDPANVGPFLAWSEHVSAPFIVGGDTPRGKHAVIYERGKLIHDPNPNHGRTGVDAIDDAIFLFGDAALAVKARAA
jgi:hypothetical protein